MQMKNKSIAISVKNKVQEYFEKKVMTVGIKYRREMQSLRNQFQNLRMDLMKSELLFRKFIDMFKDQEMLISYIRTRVRVNWKGEMSIHDIAGMDPKRSKFEDSVYEKDTSEVRDELIELNNRYEILEDSYDKLKELSKSITDDWQASELKVRELKFEIGDLKIQHKAYIEQLKEEFKQREQKLIKENNEISGNFDNFRNSITKELKIKCTLLERYVKYVEVMKKEMVLLKNIIKNPELMKSAMRTINYSDFELYRFQHNDSCELLNSGLEESAFNIKETRKASMIIKDIDKERKLLASQITNRKHQISTVNPKIMNSRIFSRGNNRSVKFRNHKRSRSSIATVTNISQRRHIVNLSHNHSKLSTPKAGEYRFNVSIGSQ